MNDERYTARLKLRMTAEDKKMIQDKAAAANMTMSEFVRALVDRKKIVVAPELPELLRQIIRVGTNVNQILLKHISDNISFLIGIFKFVYHAVRIFDDFIFIV